MVLRILAAFACLLAIIGGIFILWPGADVEQIIPADSAVVMVMQNPMNLAIKISDSDIANRLRSIKATGPFFDLVDNVMKNVESLGVVSLIDPKLYMAIPEDIASREIEDIPFTTYLHIGRATKVISLFRLGRKYQSQSKIMNYHGHTLYVQEDLAMVVLPGTIVLGPQDEVMKAVSCYEGKEKSLADNKQTATAISRFDGNADFSVLLSNGKIFSPSEKFKVDPRKLINADAFETGAGNLYIETDQIRLEMELQHKQGMLLLPDTLDKPLNYRFTKFMSDEFFAVAATRFEDMTTMTDKLSAMIGTGGGDPGGLKNKITQFAVGMLLQSMGPEFAVILPAMQNPDPVFLVQIKDVEKLKKELKAKTVKNSADTDTLAKLLETTPEALSDNPEAATKRFDALPAEKKSQVKPLLDQWMEGLGLQKKIRMFGKDFYYRIIGDNLVLSPFDWVPERIVDASNAQNAAPNFQRSLEVIDFQGSMIFSVNAVDLMRKTDAINEPDIMGLIEELSPRLALSLTGHGSKTDLRAGFGLDIGLKLTKAAVSPMVRAFYYGTIALFLVGFLLSFYLLYRLVRPLLQKQD